MNYGIKYARKGTYTLWLDKNGNKYVVGDYDTVTNKISSKEEFSLFEDADRRFLALCKATDMTPVDIVHDDFPTFD